MEKDRVIRDHFPEAPDDLGGAAENKRIDDPGIGCQFPEDKKAEKDEDPRSTDDVDMSLSLIEIPDLFRGNVSHFCSAPSR